MRLLIGACSAYNKNTATENMNHRSTYCPIEWTLYYMKGDQRRGFFYLWCLLMELRKKRLKCLQLPMGVAMNGTCIYISITESTHGCKWGLSR